MGFAAKIGKFAPQQSLTLQAAAQAAQAVQGGYLPASMGAGGRHRLSTAIGDAPLPHGHTDGYHIPPPIRVDSGMLVKLLGDAVREQNLRVFYRPSDLEAIARRLVAGRILERITERLRVPMILGIDLAKVALYDIVLLVDDSMSMKVHQGGSRIAELKDILAHITAACTLLDEDGISLRFFNSKVEGNNIKSEEQIKALVDRAGNTSGTPIGTSLDEKVLKPLVLKPAKSLLKKLRKPVLVIVITDGAPYNEVGVQRNSDKLPMVIKMAKDELARTRYGPEAVAYQFAQVGDDTKARDFLTWLDGHPEVGDMIDQTMGFEFEQDQIAKQGAELNRELWLMKLLLGAIDSTYDLQDEAPEITPFQFDG